MGCREPEENAGEKGCGRLVEEQQEPGGFKVRDSQGGLKGLKHIGEKGECENNWG